MAHRGALDGARSLAGNEALIEQFDRLARMPLAAGLDRTRLLSDIVVRVDDPGKIDQGYQNTCTVTTLEYLLASRHPAEYVRLVAGLASPQGVASRIVV